MTNLYGNDVAVLDLDTLAVVARNPVGDKLNGISCSPVAPERQPTTTLHLPDDSEAQTEPSDGEGHQEGATDLSGGGAHPSGASS